MQYHPIGTEVYYASDIANPAGFGKIVRLEQSPRFGATYDIELEDGCQLLGIPTVLVSNKYEGHHSLRFVLKAAYDAYWKQRAEAPAWFHGIEHMTLDEGGWLCRKFSCGDDVSGVDVVGGVIRRLRRRTGRPS